MTFVILTWNSERYIKDCLNSIASFEQLSTKVIVVDNGSSDATISHIHASLPGTDSKLIEQRHNCGTTVSRNIALREAADSDYICVLDSDTIVNEDAFLNMIDVLDRDPSIGLAGPTMRDGKDVEQLSGRNLPSLGIKLRKAVPIASMQERGSQMEIPSTPIVNGIQDVPYLLSACWLFRSELLQAIGYLDENIFYAPEDVDYCVRVWNAGYRVVRCWDVHIVHDYQRISKKKMFSAMNMEHLKGLVYYFKKYGYIFDSSKVTKAWRQM